MLTTQQLADKWGITRRAVRALVQRGRIPEAEKVGRDWVFPDDVKRPPDGRFVQNPVRNRRKPR